MIGKTGKFLCLALCFLSFLIGTTPLVGYKIRNEQDVQDIVAKSDKAIIENGKVKILGNPSLMLLPIGPLSLFLTSSLGAAVLYSSMKTDDAWIKRICILCSALAAIGGGFLFANFVDLLEKRLETDFDKSFITIDKDGIMFGGGFFKEGEVYFRWSDIECLKRATIITDGVSHQFLNFVLRDESKMLTYKNLFVGSPQIPLDAGVVVSGDFLPMYLGDFHAIADYYWREYHTKILSGVSCDLEVFDQKKEVCFSEGKHVINSENKHVFDKKNKLVVESGGEVFVEDLQLDDLVNIIVESNGILHLKDVLIKSKTDLRKDRLLFLCQKDAKVIFDNVSIYDFTFSVQGRFIVEKGGVNFKDCDVAYESREESFVASGSTLTLENSHFNYVVDERPSGKKETPLVFEDKNAMFHCLGKSYFKTIAQNFLFKKGTFSVGEDAMPSFEAVQGGAFFFGDGECKENDVDIIIWPGACMDILAGEFHYDNVL